MVDMSSSLSGGSGGQGPCPPVSKSGILPDLQEMRWGLRFLTLGDLAVTTH